MKKFTTICASLFLALFGVLGLFHLATPDQEFSTQERRPLAKAPTPTLSSWFDGQFASQTSKWLADQFPARPFWLSLKAQTQQFTGQADNDRVYFARDNYLIEIHESLDETKLRRNIGDVVSFIQNFWPAGRPASLLLAPTVAGVSPDLLPPGSQEAPQADILTDLRSLADASGIYAPDLLGALQGGALQGGDLQEGAAAMSDASDPVDGNAVSSGQQLYFRTDHHWTQDGARLAFLTWLEGRELGGEANVSSTFRREIVTNDFRGTTAAKANLWTVPSDSIAAYRDPSLDRVKLVDKEGTLIREGIYDEAALATYDPYEFFVGENRDWLKLETGSEGSARGRHLLLFKDSYANALVPFLCPYYETITMVDLRYLNEGMADLLERADYSEVMFLYNVVTLADENSTFKLLK